MCSNSVSNRVVVEKIVEKILSLKSITSIQLQVRYNMPFKSVTNRLQLINMVIF